MRTFRLPLAATVTLVLLGWSGGVMAQGRMRPRYG